MPNLNSNSIAQISDPANTAIQFDKKQLRAKIRKLRRALTQSTQRKASDKLIKQINKSQLLLKHQHIALYLGNDGELNPQKLIKQLWKQKKRVYLPVIHPLYHSRLRFCLVTPYSRLIKNKYGIFEPDFKHSQHIPNKCLSLVFMPLVAFDRAGNRMGMGGGFYDRSFAYKANTGTKYSKPSLIGIAHAFQEQEDLPVEAWDIPLEGVLTDQGFYQFKMKSGSKITKPVID